MPTSNSSAASLRRLSDGFSQKMSSPRKLPISHIAEPRLRAALYARVSTEEQALEGHSIDAQLRVMREFCQRRGWTVVGDYVDPGVSGKTMRRPEMQRLLLDARRTVAPFDVIVVHKLDRFSRNIIDTLTTLRELHLLGISFASATQPIDYTTPEGKMMLMMLSLFAEIYIDNLSSETKKGLEERARKGLQNGTLPFGYAPRMKHPESDADKVPVFHSTNIEGYRLAIRMSADGISTREVIRTLNARGYRTSGHWGARPFGVDTLTAMLKNRFYLGEVYFKGQWLPGKHEPAIDPETWRRCQEQIERRARHRLDHHHFNTRVYVLRQLLVCQECGNRLRGWANPKGMRFYFDPAVLKGHTCNQPPYAKAQTLEEQIGVMLTRIRLPEDWQTHVLDLLQESEDDGESERRERERKQLEGQRDRLKVLFQLGDIGEDEYRAERGRLLSRIDELRPIEPSRQMEMERAAGLLSNISQIWTKATDAEREALVRSIFQKIYVHNKMIVAVESKGEFYSLLAVACGMDPKIKVLEVR